MYPTDNTMTHIDFYILEQQPPTAIYPFACQLIEKLLQQNQRAFVVCNNAQECETLNQLLWNYNDISFIPHCLANDAVAAETPILIGLLTELTNQTIVLNLSNATISQLNQIKRLIEIVPDEPAWRQASRQKFISYKNQDCELSTHKVV